MGMREGALGSASAGIAARGSRGRRGEGYRPGGCRSRQHPARPARRSARGRRGRLRQAVGAADQTEQTPIGRRGPVPVRVDGAERVLAADLAGLGRGSTPLGAALASRGAERGSHDCSRCTVARDGALASSPGSCTLNHHSGQRPAVCLLFPISETNHHRKIVSPPGAAAGALLVQPANDGGVLTRSGPGRPAIMDCRRWDGARAAGFCPCLAAPGMGDWGSAPAGGPPQAGADPAARTRPQETTPAPEPSGPNRSRCRGLSGPGHPRSAAASGGQYSEG